MFLKLILLCCILCAIESGGASKSRGCRGRCVKSESSCHKTVLSSKGCQKDKFCCPSSSKRNRKHRKNGKLRTKERKPDFSECKVKAGCRRAGGHCIKDNQECKGTLDQNGCRGRKCQCCIPNTLAQIVNVPANKEHKFSRNSGKEHRRKEQKFTKKERKSPKSNNRKKDKGCKKKKKCTGFCINTEKEEECAGAIDPKGCKGKHCACCTPDDEEENGINESSQNSEEAGGDSNYYGDYDYYNYYDNYGNYDNYIGYGCHGKDVNGSCVDQGCFICGDGQCYPQYYKCDQYDDCADGSDELGCPPPPPVPHYIPGGCPMDYKWVVRSCYQVVARSSSWPDAQTVCRALNGQLANIYDHKLFTAYMQAFHESVQAVYWVGIHRVGGNYTWTNGTLLPNNSSLWGTTGNLGLVAEGKDCVVLDVTESLLHTINCEANIYNNQSVYSVCEYVADDYDYWQYD